MQECTRQLLASSDEVSDMLRDSPTHGLDGFLDPSWRPPGSPFPAGNPAENGEEGAQIKEQASKNSGVVFRHIFGGELHGVDSFFDPN